MFGEGRSNSIRSNTSSFNKNFYIVSSHGAVLFYIAVHPDCTIRQIADAMSLTQRSVWGVIGGLRRTGTIEVRRDGRLHRYRVNLDGPFLHPTLNGYTLRSVLGELVRSARENHLDGHEGRSLSPLRGSPSHSALSS